MTLLCFQFQNKSFDQMKKKEKKSQIYKHFQDLY